MTLPAYSWGGLVFMFFLGSLLAGPGRGAPAWVDFRTGTLEIQDLPPRPRKAVLEALLDVPWQGGERLRDWARKRPDRRSGLSHWIRTEVPARAKGSLRLPLARLGPWMPEILDWTFEASQAPQPKSQGPALSLILPRSLPEGFRPSFLPEVRSLSGRRLLPRTLTLTRLLAQGTWILHRPFAGEDAPRLGLPVRSVSRQGILYLHDEVAEKFEAILLRDPPQNLILEYPQGVPRLRLGAEKPPLAPQEPATPPQAASGPRPLPPPKIIPLESLRPKAKPPQAKLSPKDLPETERLRDRPPSLPPARPRVEASRMAREVLGRARKLPALPKPQASGPALPRPLAQPDTSPVPRFPALPQKERLPAKEGSERIPSETDAHPIWELLREDNQAGELPGAP